jgi:hypothetical protein
MLHTRIPEHNNNRVPRLTCCAQHRCSTNRSEACRRYRCKYTNRRKAPNRRSFCRTSGDPTLLWSALRSGPSHLRHGTSSQGRFIPVVPRYGTLGSVARSGHTLQCTPEPRCDTAERIQQPTIVLEQVLATNEDFERCRHEVPGWSCSFWCRLGINGYMSRPSGA